MRMENSKEYWISKLKELKDAKKTGSSVEILDSYVESQVEKIKPSTIVDFGAGRGKNGMISRVVMGNSSEVCAVEVFEPLAKKLQEGDVYNSVYHDEIISWIEKNDKKYDLAIFGDVLEHFEKDEIYHILYLALKYFKNIIVNVPLKSIDDKENEGNKWEQHKAYLRDGDFDMYKLVEKHMVRMGKMNYYKMNIWIENKKLIDDGE